MKKELKETRNLLSFFRRLAKSNSRLDYKQEIFELQQKEVDLISKMGKSTH